MTPQEIRKFLWDCYDNLEKISLESTRTTQEMMQGSEVNEYLSIALDAIGRSIFWINDEYFAETIENLESENCKSYE